MNFKRVSLKLGVLVAAVALLGPAAVAPATAANFAVCINALPGDCGDDPNALPGSGSLNAFVVGNAGDGPLDPFLLLLAVPSLPFSGVPATAPDFDSNATVTVAPATISYYGGNVPDATGYLGELTAASLDLYAFAGLAGANNSMSFANFTLGGAGGAEATLLGGLPTSFSIYEFTIDINGHADGTTVGDGQLYSIPYTSIPLGTYIGAYGRDAYPARGTFYDSPFTTAGWVNSSGSSSGSSGSSSGSSGEVSEPNSSLLSLLGVALLGIAMWGRRRSHHA